ncbi:MAG: UDP-glucose 4-epimerase GalE [Limnochordia bacterium]|jgi:UDP-glucose 4-epimerase|nr:UDP-glucose 4-epimerase GalE [Limnochordia bacterium]MDD2629186.1 UDP-glucose 4-epimerase GalE [Limnochordia bacterium]MDD4517388.1 UDP-glucose 4-epimerase GalE [Limnochordia bacterium]
MRILVTGGAGYVGSHTARHLQEAGHFIVTYDNLYKGHEKAVTGTFIKGDLADQEHLSNVFRKYRFDAVMHFAAHSLVGESVKSPDKYFRNNILGGLNLLDMMAIHEVKYLVFSSTAAVYGEPKEVPIPEDHPTIPTSPYGESKLFFEKILRRYDQAYGIKSIALRYFNAAGADPTGHIGEDHSPETHLIPIILQVALGQRPELSIFGNDYPTPDGTCIRDYVHVMDLADAHLLALNALAAGSPTTTYNLGNGKGFSVMEVLKTTERVVGRTIPYKFTPRRAGDPAVLVASSDKIMSTLGWKRKYPRLETIIEHAWKWHKQHPHGFAD